MTLGSQLCSPARGAMWWGGGGTEDAGVGGTDPETHTRRRARARGAVPILGLGAGSTKQGLWSRGYSAHPRPGTHDEVWRQSWLSYLGEGRRHPVGRGGVTHRPHGPVRPQHLGAALIAGHERGAWRRQPHTLREGVSDCPVSPPLARHRPPAACVYTHTTPSTHT